MAAVADAFAKAVVATAQILAGVFAVPAEVLTEIFFTANGDPPAAGRSAATAMLLS